MDTAAGLACFLLPCSFLLPAVGRNTGSWAGGRRAPLTSVVFVRLGCTPLPMFTATDNRMTEGMGVLHDCNEAGLARQHLPRLPRL